MIPRIIHYCWFGKKPLPSSFKKNIESWKKFFPDYKIIQWDETNFDLHCNQFVENAYREKQFAFVSDYARFYILRNMGGIFFDTDVKVIKNLDDILKSGPYMGEQSKGIIAAGLGMAMEPDMPFLKEIEDFYNKKESFIDPASGKKIIVVKVVTDVLKKHGYDSSKEGVQNVYGISIYPPEFFCPIQYPTGITHFTENTRTIHFFAASWFPRRSQLKHRFRMMMGKRFGRTGAMIAQTLINLLKWIIKAIKFPYHALKGNH